jgi:hypothetical protein
LLSASYLRHSSDIPMLEKLYPYIETSLNQVLQNKKEDGLVWAYRPDWWDIGRSYGPRSYMTILTIRALREFIYVSTVLNKNLNELSGHEKLALDMQKQLTERLWDDDLKYLINYFEDGSKDSHLYIGSLLAAHFDLLDQGKKTALLETAKRNLLDENRDVIIAHLETQPPATLKEARVRIEEITGIKRSLPQIRAFLKKTPFTKESETSSRKGQHRSTRTFPHRNTGASGG